MAEFGSIADGRDELYSWDERHSAWLVIKTVSESSRLTFLGGCCVGGETFSIRGSAVPQLGVFKGRPDSSNFSHNLPLTDVDVDMPPPLYHPCPVGDVHLCGFQLLLLAQRRA